MIELLKKYLRYAPLFFIFVSCSVSTPVIRENKWDINIINDRERGVVYENLSLFVNCYDDDGEDDIVTLFIIDDESGLYWELNEGNWLKTVVHENIWIGSNAISMADLSPIPRRKFRINIRDMAGEVAEDEIFITKRKIDYKDLRFPELIVNNDEYRLKSYDSGKLFIYSQESEVLATANITDRPQNINKLLGKNISDFAEDIRIFISVKDGDLNLESGPWN